MKISDTPRPLFAHIQELRKRLLIIFAGWIFGTFICYGYSEKIFYFLLIPFEQATSLRPHSLMYLGLAEAFSTYLKVAFWGGSLLNSPLFIYETWKFILPALKPHEQKLIGPFFVAAPFLFILGALFAYYAVIPLAWNFFLSFENTSLSVPILLEARMSEYFSLTFSFLISFGLSFEFPLVLIILAHLGFLSSQALVLNRKYAIILIFIVAALLTPPDVLSQILLAIPLMILYEGAIWIIRRNEHLKLEKLKHHV